MCRADFSANLERNIVSNEHLNKTQYSVSFDRTAAATKMFDAFSYTL